MTISAEILYQLHRQQRGGGGGNNLLYYKSRYNRQRGSGLGSIFGSIGKYVVPWIKNVIWPAAKKYALPHAKQAALGLAGDVIIDGKKVGQSIRTQGKRAIKGATQQVLDQYQSGGKKGRRARKVVRRKVVKIKTIKRKTATKKKAIKKQILFLPSHVNQL